MPIISPHFELYLKGINYFKLIKYKFFIYILFLINFLIKDIMTSNLIDKSILYVGGLDENVDEKILHAAFIPFGEVKSIELPKDYTTRRFIYLIF